MKKKWFIELKANLVKYNIAKNSEFMLLLCREFNAFSANKKYGKILMNFTFIFNMHIFQIDMAIHSDRM